MRQTARVGIAARPPGPGSEPHPPLGCHRRDFAEVGKEKGGFEILNQGPRRMTLPSRREARGAGGSIGPWVFHQLPLLVLNRQRACTDRRANLRGRSLTQSNAIPRLRDPHHKVHVPQPGRTPEHPGNDGSSARLAPLERRPTLMARCNLGHVPSPGANSPAEVVLEAGKKRGTVPMSLCTDQQTR